MYIYVCVCQRERERERERVRARVCKYIYFQIHKYFSYVSNSMSIDMLWQDEMSHALPPQDSTACWLRL